MFPTESSRDIKKTQSRRPGWLLAPSAPLSECHGLGTSYHLPSILDKLTLNADDFYMKTLGYATHHVLRDLKNHSRILVPGLGHLLELQIPKSSSVSNILVEGGDISVAAF